MRARWPRPLVEATVQSFEVQDVVNRHFDGESVRSYHVGAYSAGEANREFGEFNGAIFTLLSLGYDLSEQPPRFEEDLKFVPKDREEVIYIYMYRANQNTSLMNPKKWRPAKISEAIDSARRGSRMGISGRPKSISRKAPKDRPPSGRGATPSDRACRRKACSLGLRLWISTFTFFYPFIL